MLEGSVGQKCCGTEPGVWQSGPGGTWPPAPERCPQKTQVVGPLSADTNSVSERSEQTMVNLLESDSADRNLPGKRLEG